MKRTVSLLTAALFAGALAAPVLAQEGSPAAAPSMAAPMGEGSPSAEASPVAHHHHVHHHHHHHTASGEMAPSGGMASPAAAPSGQ